MQEIRFDPTNVGHLKVLRRLLNEFEDYQCGKASGRYPTGAIKCSVLGTHQKQLTQEQEAHQKELERLREKDQLLVVNLQVLLTDFGELTEDGAVLLEQGASAA